MNDAMFWNLSEEEEPAGFDCLRCKHPVRIRLTCDTSERGRIDDINAWNTIQSCDCGCEVLFTRSSLKEPHTRVAENGVMWLLLTERMREKECHGLMISGNREVPYYGPAG